LLARLELGERALVSAAQQTIIGIKWKLVSNLPFLMTETVPVGLVWSLSLLNQQTSYFSSYAFLP
jgi:hypothetical protein